MTRDGRRTSDPLTDPNGSPAQAPLYQLWAHRTAAETNAPILAAPTDEKNGINFGGSRRGLIQAIPRDGADIGDAPGGGDTITLTEYEWSPGAGAFVATGNVYVAGGAGQPISEVIDSLGRILYYAVTGVTDSVSIYASQFGVDQTM